MNNVGMKFREIIKPLFILAILFIPSYTLFDYYLTIKYEIIKLERGMVDGLFPTLLVFILINIFITKKFELLKLKSSQYKDKILYVFFALLVIVIPTIFFQEYLEYKEEELIVVNNINQIKEYKKFKVYDIKNIKFLKESTRTFLDHKITLSNPKGRDEKLSLYFYIVCPIILSNDKKYTNKFDYFNILTKHWYSIKFYRKIDNKLSEEKKEELIKSFKEESIKSYENSLKSIQYLTKVDSPIDEEGFINAIKSTYFSPNFIVNDNDITIFTLKKNKIAFHSPWHIILIFIFLFTIFTLTIFFAESKRKIYLNGYTF